MIRAFFVALILPLIVTASAVAAPVLYTFTGVASGRVGDSAFADTAFVVEVQAQTGDVVSIDLAEIGFPGFVVFGVQSPLASFSVEGVGSGQFTDPTIVLVNQTLGRAAFSKGLLTDLADVRDVFSLGDDAFESYDLRRSIGPIADPSPLVTATVPVLASTLGAVVFTSLTGEATFRAVVIPEPSSLALVSLPALIGAYWGRRRLRNRA